MYPQALARVHSMFAQAEHPVPGSVDLHTLGEDAAVQTPQQQQAAELIDAAKEIFGFSGSPLQPLHLP